MSYIKIDPEDFSVWRESPMGEWFFKLVKMGADDARQAWIDASWNGGKVDPILHAALKERCNAYEQLLSISAMDLEERLNEKPSSSEG